jgi:hypothetical protein
VAYENRAQLIELAKLSIPIMLGAMGYYFSSTIAPVADMAQTNRSLAEMHSISIAALSSRVLVLEERKKSLEMLVEKIDSLYETRNRDSIRANKDLQKTINELHIKITKLERD